MILRIYSAVVFQGHMVPLTGIEVSHQIRYAAVAGHSGASSLVPNLYPEMKMQVYFHQTLGQGDLQMRLGMIDWQVG
jgi:hypothetical protein